MTLHEKAIEFIEQLIKSYKSIPQSEDALERLTYIWEFLKDTE